MAGEKEQLENHLMLSSLTLPKRKEKKCGKRLVHLGLTGAMAFLFWRATVVHPEPTKVLEEWKETNHNERTIAWLNPEREVNLESKLEVNSENLEKNSQLQIINPLPTPTSLVKRKSLEEKYFSLVEDAYKYHNSWRGLTIKKIEKTAQYDHIIKRVSEDYEIPSSLLYALIVKESGGEKDARHAGAVGLTQLMYNTAKSLGKDCVKRNNPEKSIECSGRYLVMIYNLYKKNFPGEDSDELWDRTLLGYNRGHNAILGLFRHKKGNSSWDLKVNDLGGVTYQYLRHFRALQLIVEEEQKKKENQLKMN